MCHQEEPNPKRVMENARVVIFLFVVANACIIGWIWPGNTNYISKISLPWPIGVAIGVYLMALTRLVTAWAVFSHLQWWLRSMAMIGFVAMGLYMSDRANKLLSQTGLWYGFGNLWAIVSMAALCILLRLNRWRIKPPGVARLPKEPKQAKFRFSLMQLMILLTLGACGFTTLRHYLAIRPVEMTFGREGNFSELMVEIWASLITLLALLHLLAERLNLRIHRRFLLMYTATLAWPIYAYSPYFRDNTQGLGLWKLVVAAILLLIASMALLTVIRVAGYRLVRDAKPSATEPTEDS